MNNDLDPLWEVHLPGGCHWSGVIRQGMTLRLIDLEGCANAAVLFFNSEEKLERFNMADTLKTQHTFRLTSGHACHSDMGRIFCCITSDTAGWHDAVCGLSDSCLIQAKYGVARYQECRNAMYRSGLDGMLIELGKWGLGMRDVVPNINFFSKVTADDDGKLTFHPEHTKPGDYVDLAFEMDTLVIISAAPHPLDTRERYQPGAVELAIFVTPPVSVTACSAIPENARGLENTRRFYAKGGEK